ncbi:MAG: hypothetical protein J1F01_05645 [Oscillospiraceae bacterium]|nr:hypothetical protein [Oscillospiraceae bacterium]
MLFEVTRAKEWNKNLLDTVMRASENCVPNHNILIPLPPCPHPQCNKITLVNVEKCLFKSPDDYDRERRQWGKDTTPWLETGTNHRYDENGYIMRDNGTKETWGIEINSLEELLEFCRSVDEKITLRTSDIDKKTPWLEIYDNSL